MWESWVVVLNVKLNGYGEIKLNKVIAFLKKLGSMIPENKTKCNDPDLTRLLELAQLNYLLQGKEKKEYESLIDIIDERLAK